MLAKYGLKICLRERPHHQEIYWNIYRYVWDLFQSNAVWKTWEYVELNHLE